MQKVAVIALACCWLSACADTELFGQGSSDSSTTVSAETRAASDAEGEASTAVGTSSVTSGGATSNEVTSTASEDSEVSSTASATDETTSTETASGEVSDTGGTSSEVDTEAGSDSSNSTDSTETSDTADTSTESQESGDPQCHDGQIVCGGVCIYPQADPRYCGAEGDCQGSNAGVQCPEGHRCRMGECQLYCTGLTIDCNGECISPDTDPRYCGAVGDCMGINAGEACPAAEVCSLGLCGPRPDWSEPTTLDDFDLNAFANLRGVFTSREGQPAVVWDVEDRWVARSYNHANDSWTQAADGGPASFVVGVVPDGHDGLVAVWLVDDVAHWNRYLIEDGRWQFAIGRAFADVDNAFYGDMELSGHREGQVTLVYADPSFDSEDILFHNLNGDTWSAAVPVQQESRHVNYVQTEAGEGASLMVTWRHFDRQARGSSLVLYSRSRSRDGSWGPVRELHTEGVFQSFRASILGWAGDDRWLVCWFEDPPGGMHGSPDELHCSRHTSDGGGWSESKMVLSESTWSQLHSTGPGQLALIDQRGGTNLRWFEGLERENWSWTEREQLSQLRLSDIQLRRTSDAHLYLTGYHTSGPMGTVRRSYAQHRAAGADDWGLLFNLEGSRRPAMLGLSGYGRALLARIRGNTDSTSIMVQWHEP